MKRALKVAAIVLAVLVGLGIGYVVLAAWVRGS